MKNMKSFQLLKEQLKIKNTELKKFGVEQQRLARKQRTSLP